MKNVIAILLTFVIGWNVSQEAFFLLWYQFDNISFTERFCINVEEPELLCHGKCQVQKLSEQKKESPAQHIPGLLLRFNYIALLPSQFFLLRHAAPAVKAPFRFLWEYDFLAIQSHFRPPPGGAPLPSF